RRRDHDIGLLRILTEQRLLRLKERVAHLPRVAPMAFSVLLDVEFDELSPETFHLLTRRRAGIEGTDLRAETLRSCDRRQTGNTRAHNKHLCWCHLPGGGHLARNEAAKPFCRFDHRAVS